MQATAIIIDQIQCVNRAQFRPAVFCTILFVWRRSRHIDTAVLKVDAERVGRNAAAAIDVIDGGGEQAQAFVGLTEGIVQQWVELVQNKCRNLGALTTDGGRTGSRLAALVPKPRVNLTRYHGILAPNHRWRGLVTPAKRGKGAMRPVDSDVVSSIQRHAAMTWVQRLKRVFNIDIEVCSRCGGSVRVIACIEDQDVIDRILAHLRETEKEAPARPLLVPPTRAPPDTLSLFAGTEFHQQGRH